MIPTPTARFHFWRRTVGPLPIDPASFVARLDSGRLVEYHCADQDRARAEALLRAGIWDWEYLGAGVIVIEETDATRR